MIKFYKLKNIKTNAVYIYINNKINNCYKHESFMAAGNITYKIIISAIPAAIVVTILFSGVPAIEAWLMDALKPVLAPQAYGFLQYVMQLANKYASAPVLPVSVIVMAYTVSSGMYSLLKGISTAVDGGGVFEKRGVVKNRLIAVAFTTSIILCIFLVWAISTFSEKIGIIKNKQALQYVMSTAMLVIILFMMYKISPITHIKRSIAFIRALISSIAIVLLSFALNIYYSVLANPENIYGTFAGVAILMMWIYGITLCILIAGEI